MWRHEPRRQAPEETPEETRPDHERPAPLAGEINAEYPYSARARPVPVEAGRVFCWDRSSWPANTLGQKLSFRYPDMSCIDTENSPSGSNQSSLAGCKQVQISMRTRAADTDQHGGNAINLQPMRWDSMHLLSLNASEIEDYFLENDTASGVIYQATDRLSPQETPRPVANVALSRDYARSIHTCSVTGDDWSGVLQINGLDGQYHFNSHAGQKVSLSLTNAISMTRLEETRSPEHVVMAGHEQVRGVVDRPLWPEVFSLYANNILIADAVIGYYGPRFKQRAGWSFFRRQMTRCVLNRALSDQRLLFSRIGVAPTPPLAILAAAYAMLLRNVVWPGVPHNSNS